MPPDPSPIEANMGQFRTLASPPYDVNAPKPKREKLTRSRDGCLTCRVRRKKCSGMPEVGGACEACQRLAIECLGYSAKRPAWMQNNDKLQECRREIRLWLAERGKGPRAIELLSLAKYYGDETPSNAPPTPNGKNTPKTHASNERRTRRMANAMSWVEEEDELDGDEDGDEDGDGDREESDEHKLEMVTNKTNLPAPKLPGAPPNAVPAHLQYLPQLHQQHSANSSHHQSHSSPSQQQASGSRPSTAPRGLSTDLNQSYRWNFLDDAPDSSELDSEGTLNDPSKLSDERHDHRAALSNVRDTTSSSLFNDAPVASLVTMWSSTVRSFRHRFANPKYFQELCQIMISEPDVQAVTRNLAAIHGFNRNFGTIDAPEVKTARVELTKVQMAVKAKLLEDSRSQTPTIGHALAAIFGLSYVLFTGGNGDWNSYLEVATNWLDRQFLSILQGGAKFSYATAFLCETTIWMDILGSISLQHAPKLHKYYVKFLSNDENADNPGVQFLTRVLGCENRVMLGIATISALAGWKNQQSASGTSQAKELSDKAHAIELAYLSPPKQPLTFQVTVLPSESMADESADEDGGGVSAMQQAPTELVPLAYEKPIDRPRATDVFRTTARVYLSTVVNGCLPDNEEVAAAVSQALKVFKNSDINEADRALLFGLAMVGSLVVSEEDKEFIRQKFKSLNGVEKMGNSIQALQVVEEIWQRREVDGPLEWWTVSRERGNLQLLA